MSAPPITTDIYGNRYAAVPVEELDDWRWLLTRLEDWLLRDDPEIAADWAEFTGPCGPKLEEIIYVLGQWSIRMRNLAEGGGR